MCMIILILEMLQLVSTLTYKRHLILLITAFYCVNYITMAFMEWISIRAKVWVGEG